MDFPRSTAPSSGSAGARPEWVDRATHRGPTIPWDRKTGYPIPRAIVWQCRRTAGLSERLRSDGLEVLFRRKTGLVLDAYFSGTKIRWLLDEVPGARRQAESGGGAVCAG